MNLYVRPSAHSPAMDDYIVEVTRCEVSHRSQQICHTSIEGGRGVAKPMWHTSHSQSIPLGMLTTVYGMSFLRIRI